MNWLYQRKHGCTAAIHDNQALPLFEVQQMKQATRANRQQVEQHIQRQRTLGERMIGDNDKPRGWEFAASAFFIGLALIGMWWNQ